MGAGESFCWDQLLLKLVVVDTATNPVGSTVAVVREGRRQLYAKSTVVCFVPSLTGLVDVLSRYPSRTLSSPALAVVNFVLSRAPLKLTAD